MSHTIGLLERNVPLRPGSKRRPRWRALLLLWGITTAALGQEPGAAIQDRGPSVLTRGPVHEAFAAPVVHDPGPGLVVAKEPPAAVEELPPDQKPAGQNVQWISGYWSWDQARGDFVWISGVWREPPPGRQWVPGYWHRAPGGFQWVPGAWVPIGAAAAEPADESAAREEATYLPAPPAALEQGPNSLQPAGNVFWTPGCWYWLDNRYVWHPGFWAAAQPNWLWVPAHYVWTPGGFLFVAGYWDLPLASRGVLFAPVYYAQPVYLNPAYVFTPSVTIATTGLMANLFVMPNYHHYCFGDYYDRRFFNAGVVPWFSFIHASGPAHPVHYDPLFTFYSSVNVPRDPGWTARLRADYLARRDQVALRPPRTYDEQTRIIERNANVTIMARPLSQTARDGRTRFEHLNLDDRRRSQEQGLALRELREQRSRQEQQAVAWRTVMPAGGRRADPAGSGSRPRPMRMAPSPVAAPLHAHAEPNRRVSAVLRHEDVATAGMPQSFRLPHDEQDGGDSHSVTGPASGSLRRQRSPLPSLADHVRSPSRVAPHDARRDPQPPRAALHIRQPGEESKAPRLHAPPQYTHRQPPPVPRPLPKGQQRPQ